MPITAPLTSASFYEKLPPPDHRTGDIWRGLPTFDLFGDSSSSGVVITPACDLANKKCETVTYLPIIPVSDYVGSPAFRHECWQEITQVLSRLPDYGAIVPPSRYGLICDADLGCLVQPGKDANGKPLPEADLARLSAYQEYVTASRCGNASMKHLKSFIKPERLASLLSKLATNALKPDIHFLPQDGQPQSYSAVPVHSVVLFRYTLTIPISALQLAQDCTEAQWSVRQKESAPAVPALKHMPSWPIKVASLRGEFLSDLISRYLNMYIRLGSTDFSEESVRSMIHEIGASA
jgi:hypothetical protein